MSAVASFTLARERIASLGAGRMGRSIAAAFALAGQPSVLVDLRERSDEAAQALRDSVEAELRAIFTRLQGLGVLGSASIDDLLARVQLVGRAEAAARLRETSLLFEAVPETLDAKREALAEACRHLPPEAVIASTSSTMLARELAGFVTRPERFLNAHWLNPAYLVPLVEVSPHEGTDASVTAHLVGLLEACGKVPVRCGGQPGYIVPRLQVLLMNEAARMIEQGAASAADIDKAIRYGFGIRYATMGVAEFIDFGGVDILFHASRYLADRLGDERYACPPIVTQKMHEGDLGMKTGQGFYRWEPEVAAEFQERSLQQFVSLLRLQQAAPAR